MKAIKLFLLSIFIILNNNTLLASRYDIIIKKDIFDEKRGADRNPPEEIQKAADREQLGKYYLAGIIKIHNNIHGAYIKPSPDGKPEGSILLKKGDKLEGWTVEEIKEKKIILKNAEKTYEINLWEPEKGVRKGAPKLGFISSPQQINPSPQPPTPSPPPPPHQPPSQDSPAQPR